MSYQNGAHVYTGQWINYSHGPILGATLTLTNRDAGLLTAFLAIFVSAAGAALWRIFSYIIHQVRASNEQHDGLHHQQQNTLRNTSAPGGASIQFIQLAWYWRKSAERPFMRSLSFALFALFHLAIFGIAGVFSSQVTKAAGDESLIVSPNCGIWAPDPGLSTQSLFALSSKTLNDTFTAASYARTCYEGNHDPLRCKSYAQPQIKWTTNQNASCPFAKGTCLMSDTAAYSMDTGPIDSHDVLGINAPMQDRITYRKVTTCAPLHTKGFVTNWNATGAPGTPGKPGDLIQKVWYGPVATVANYTLAYNTHAALDNVGYSLTSLEALGGYGDNVWIPVPELNRTDADVSIFLLAPNSIRYDVPVDDPFFSAHLVGGSVISSGNNVTWYTTDTWLHAMGCIDQHQFCNPTNNECTDLTASNIVPRQFKRTGMNNVQLTISMRLQLQLMYISTYDSVNGRGPASLRAQETVFELDQAPLPNNQWMVEVSSWYAVGLAKLQQAIVEYATGPPFVVEGSHIMSPPDSISVAMCGSQKVRDSSTTTSFSILGVAIIAIVGGLFIITNLVLDIVVGAIQKGLRKGSYRRLQWILDEKLQLQRMAYEEAGMGMWSGLTDAVPVTKYGETFGLPSDIDPEDPRLGTATPPGRNEAARLMDASKEPWVEHVAF